MKRANFCQGFLHATRSGPGTEWLFIVEPDKAHGYKAGSFSQQIFGFGRLARFYYRCYVRGDEICLQCMIEMYGEHFITSINDDFIRRARNTLESIRDRD